MRTPDLQKFSTADFDSLKWHDNRIFGWRMDSSRGEFSLDIDHILEWVLTPDGNAYNWRMAPAVLKFENVWEISIDIQSSSLVVDIDQIEMGELDAERRSSIKESFSSPLWKIICNEGEIVFAATGFELALQAAPVLLPATFRSLCERGGCFL